jgi:two-component system, LytTR family, sensor histidine kinase AlgZ
MHPILARSGRLASYLLPWGCLGAVLAYLLGINSGLGWEGVAVALPLCLFYALVCLTPWYTCRFLPLAGGQITKAVLNQVAAAFIASVMWLGVARLLGWALSGVYPKLPRDLSPNYLLLFGLGVLLYLLAVAMHYVYLAVETSQEAIRREHEAQVLAREAELKALKAQINPHFLFNCLHSISALTTIDAGQARDMCIKLSDFLRNTLRLGERANITFAEELALVKTYLDVEQVRFGSRLRVEQKIEETCGHCSVPPLLLQPLVENAIKHGIAGLVDGGLIRIEGRCSDGVLRIAVENDFDPEHPAPRKTGLGLSNVRSRIAARHGDRGRVDVAVAADHYRVDLLLPCDALAKPVLAKQRGDYAR